MPRFSYTARDRTGTPSSSSIEAPSRKDALRLLSARGLTPLRIDEEASPGRKASPVGKAQPRTNPADPAPSGRPASTRRRGAERGPSRRERLPFLTALEDLTSSGLSAGEAIRLLSVRIKEPQLRALSGGLWERIGEGASLSTAMLAFPGVFDSASVNLIQAGEATGSLNDVLKRIIAHLTEQRELRRQLVSALAYPVFMMFVAVGVILFFLFYLLPKLQTLLSALGGELPASTRILVATSDFLIRYGVFLLVGGAVAAIAFWRWYRTRPGREAIDAAMLKLPLLGPFAISRTVLAISQTLSVLLENGITTVEALRMTARQIVNSVHREAFEEASNRVLEGEALSQALGRTACFPDLVLDQLSVGENTGNIVPALKKVSVTYQQTISQQLNVFTKIIASGVLMSVFVFVGFIAYAIVSAVFQLSSSFKM
ncbi:MAG: type II secretion system F family protein [Opitutaceae bacterium]|nr:type II secretion system F family protein [Opitutaceae bacterium]